MTQKKSTGLATQALPRAIILGALDVISIVVSLFAALFLRFDFRFNQIPEGYLQEYLDLVLPWCAICVVVFICCNLYRSIWSFASVEELLRILGAYLVLAVVGFALVVLLKIEMPRSFYVLGGILSIICTVGIRFSYRLLRGMRQLLRVHDGKNQPNIMIIGAGEAGRMLVNEYTTSKYAQGFVACVIDDNPNKRNKLLVGVPIVGGREDIPEMVKRYRIQRIVYAIPSSPASTRKEVLDICSTTGCEVQIVPGIYQMANGDVSVSKLRQVDPQDLLGRDPIRVNMEEIWSFISGKVVMVTGGGGSIGSELCRQIARANPRQLIIFDIYENNAYDIQMELQRTCP